MNPDEFPTADYWLKMMMDKLFPQEENHDEQQIKNNNNTTLCDTHYVLTPFNSIPTSSIREGFVMVNPEIYNCPVHGNCSLTGFITPGEETETTPIKKISSKDTIIDDIKPSGDDDDDTVIDDIDDYQEQEKIIVDDDEFEISINLSKLYNLLRPSLFFVKAEISNDSNNHKLNAMKAKIVLPAIERSFAPNSHFVTLIVGNYIYAVSANRDTSNFFKLTDDELSFFIRKEFSLSDETI